MDEREQELNALREYGFGLLEKMRYPELLEMLQGILTHLHDIAVEYSNEANSWRVRYDECEAHNQKLQQQLQDLKAANNAQVDKLQKTIQIQSDTIESLEKDFNSKLNELRSYRDNEVKNYNAHVQELILTRQSLDNMKRNLEDNLNKCISERSSLERLKSDCEETRADLQREISINKTKLDRYDELDKFQREAQAKIDQLEKTLAGKDKDVDDTINDLKNKLEAAQERNLELERELDEKSRPSSDNDDSVIQDSEPVYQEIAEENFAHNDDEDDNTK